MCQSCCEEIVVPELQVQVFFGHVSFIPFARVVNRSKKETEDFVPKKEAANETNETKCIDNGRPGLRNDDSNRDCL